MLCREVCVRVHVAQDRLPLNNSAANLDRDDEQIQDRATSHTSAEISASEELEILRRRTLTYLCKSPTPRSQGCEVARVLPNLDTGAKNKFPVLAVCKGNESAKRSAKEMSFSAPQCCYKGEYFCVMPG